MKSSYILLLSHFSFIKLIFSLSQSFCLSLSLSLSLSIPEYFAYNLGQQYSCMICIIQSTLTYALQALGKNGRIIKIDQDGDVRVKVEDRAWIFSPVCINPVDNPEEAKEIPAIPAAECVDSDTIETVETQSNGR